MNWLTTHPAYRILKYLISGGLAAVTNLGCLYVLTNELHVWYVASAVLSFLLGMVVSFTLQKFWTFSSRETKRMHVEAGQFLLVALTNLAINTVGIYILVDYVHMWYLLAEFLLLGFLAVVSFSFYRMILTT